jgi:hypothetical protein
LFNALLLLLPAAAAAVVGARGCVAGSRYPVTKTGIRLLKQASIVQGLALAAAAAAAVDVHNCRIAMCTCPAALSTSVHVSVYQCVRVTPPESVLACVRAWMSSMKCTQRIN